MKNLNRIENQKISNFNNTDLFSHKLEKKAINLPDQIEEFSKKVDLLSLNITGDDYIQNKNYYSNKRKLLYEQERKRNMIARQATVRRAEKQMTFHGDMIKRLLQNDNSKHIMVKQYLRGEIDNVTGSPILKRKKTNLNDVSASKNSKNFKRNDTIIPHLNLNSTNSNNFFLTTSPLERTQDNFTSRSKNKSDSMLIKKVIKNKMNFEPSKLFYTSTNLTGLKSTNKNFNKSKFKKDLLKTINTEFMSTNSTAGKTNTYLNTDSSYFKNTRLNTKNDTLYKTKFLQTNTIQSKFNEKRTRNNGNNDKTSMKIEEELNLDTARSNENEDYFMLNLNKVETDEEENDLIIKENLIENEKESITSEVVKPVYKFNKKENTEKVNNIVQICRNQSKEDKMFYSSLEKEIEKINPVLSYRQKLPKAKVEEDDMIRPENKAKKYFIYGKDKGIFMCEDIGALDLIQQSNRLSKIQSLGVYKFREVIAGSMGLEITKRNNELGLSRIKRLTNEEITKLRTDTFKRKHKIVKSVLEEMEKGHHRMINGINSYLNKK